MKSKIHYILLLVTLALSIACGIMLPHVNVNSDMTKYLPSDSRMKQGLEIITTEFSGAQVQSADVKAMFPDVEADEREVLTTQLSQMPDVRDVSSVVSADSAYTLFNLVVPKSVDQKALGVTIRERYGNDVIVETSQDGATPPFSVIVISAVFIFFILFLMAQSWLDPLLILIATGMAVIINVGTNMFLPNVSITTNYIAPILQLVLSLDYSIVLMNRYRQEMDNNRTPVEAVNVAIRRAFRPIISSALTTVVGLLMLLFMRLKIGMDMGIVLAKGVIFSMVCTFTVLPALLLVFNKALQKTTKRVFVLPVDKLSFFVTHHKVSLAISLVLLFGTVYFFAQKTEIYFSTNGESRIEEVFPKMNPFVVVYHTEDETNIFELADSLNALQEQDKITHIISYPTLLKKSYTAPDLTAYVKRLSAEMEDYMPAMAEVEMLTPELMQMVYYLHSGAGDTLTIGFTELMTFIREDCLDNPLFAGEIDERMREQIKLLDGLLAMQKASKTDDEEEEEEEEPEEQPELVMHDAPIIRVIDDDKPTAKEEDKPHMIKHEKKRIHTDDTKNGKYSLIAFVAELDDLFDDDETHYLRNITDTTLLHKNMNVRQMSDFIGSTHAQTKMVFAMSDEGKRMTPLAYVHFLTDDLFKRKALANMVSAEQKNSLILRAKFMDYAEADAYLTPQELSEMMTEYGLLGMNERRVVAIAGGEYVPEEIIEAIEEEELAAEQDNTDHSEAIAEHSPVEPTETPVSKPTKTPKEKTEDDRRAELMLELMDSEVGYTSAQMAQNFKNLGEDIAPEAVHLLYCYYGSLNAYNDSLRMSCEELMTYVSDTLIKDPQVASFLEEESRERIEKLPEEVSNGIGMLSNDKWGLMVITTNLPDESEETYAFVDKLDSLSSGILQEPCYLVGESVMFSEMKHGFGAEMRRITLLTILAIFLIIAISFRSLLVPTLLVMTVMTAVYVNVVFSGIVSGAMLYIAYLIVQSILMGATIDYGILFTNYYKEYRKTMDEYEASKQAYRGSIRTIMTSGLIMVFGPGAMALLVDDVAISAIVGCLSIGSAVSVLLILCVLPGVLVAFDRWVVMSGKDRFKKA